MKVIDREQLEQKYPLLSKIDSPADLKELSLDELPQLCQEIRTYLLTVLSEVPGHLGASLGVVELTVALHYVLDLPSDGIVWDVGHQSYPHKLLTGRRDSFPSLRQWGGLSGFTHPNESQYDTFIAGHASNSISAALGLAVAKAKQKDDAQIVAVIGDGAMTGGMAFEGLNNVSSYPNNLLIVLNDNHISIDPITGGLSKYLLDITTSKTYNHLRYNAYRALRKAKVVNERRRSNILRFNNSVKALIADESNLFEGFNIRYIGPADGHDVRQLVSQLKTVLSFQGPKLLHIKTTKGKGYTPAETSAVTWHAPGKFDLDTGERATVVKEMPDKPLKFQEIFGRTLLEIAEQDESVVGVTPAMISGSSFNFLQDRYPDRVYDVGIAEAHAVTFSAGLSRGGKKVFCNIYSSFLQRGYDQVIHDVAMQATPMILCLDRAGLVGEDGVTHQGVYDIPYLRCVPGLTMMSPYDERELRYMMYTAYKHYEEGSFVIRYPRGAGSCADWDVPLEEIPLGKARLLKDGERVVFVSYGPVGYTVTEAIKELEQQGIYPGHLDLRFVKPLDTEALDELSEKYEHIITVEDGALAGGVGCALLEYYSDQGKQVSITRVGVPDLFVKQGAVEIQRAYVGLDKENLVKLALKLYHKQ
ncbi:MAG: 1-deoxy-D-xylulose-5-phosphate synthase [Porphyromonas sp.]|nr:1-deoxy-D-xylulose-5-phosphate synthase [Porphyromonas sp.]